MNKVITIIGVLFITLFSVSAAEGAGGNELWQVSTLQALMNGYYEGAVTVGEIKKHGNFGLGTFDKLDGEMIVVDGKVYQATVDGKVAEVKDSETTPFCNVAYALIKTVNEPSEDFVTLEYTAKDKGYDALKKHLLSSVKNRNTPWLFFISGKFPQVTVRSVPAQQKPYRKLAVVAKEQKTYTRENVEGVIVGFWFPSYFAGINATGFHLHFISAERDFGGHLLALGKGHYELIAIAKKLEQFKVVLPNAADFAMVGTKSDKKEIEAVEGK